MPRHYPPAALPDRDAETDLSGVPGLPGMPPEKTEWCLRRGRELFAAGKTVDEVREIIAREKKTEPWKNQGNDDAQKTDTDS